MRLFRKSEHEFRENVRLFTRQINMSMYFPVTGLFRINATEPLGGPAGSFIWDIFNPKRQPFKNFVILIENFNMPVAGPLRQHVLITPCSCP